MRITTKKLALAAVLTALALGLSTLENLFPVSLLVPLPGIKLGLANIVTVFALYALGPAQALLILAGRCLLGAVFAGNFSTILYSAGGGALAILTTILLKKVLKDNQLWVAGCLGAVAHSIGQMIVAIWVAGTPQLALYLPIMIGISILTGAFTGFCAQFLWNRGNRFWKTILK